MYVTYRNEKGKTLAKTRKNLSRFDIESYLNENKAYTAAIAFIALLCSHMRLQL